MGNDLYEVKPAAARQRFAGPIWTLLLLAPFIAELLSGSTRTSVLFVYVPEVMVWGVGALFCRELARRWRAGGTSLLLLGMALSIAEEFIIQQTSLAPLPFSGANADYARVGGVNLVYLLFMLGFESVWVVVVPVQVAELFFPQRAAQPWLRKRGAVVAGALFLVGSCIAWYGWTQQARPRLHAAPYSPPAGMIVLGFAMIAGLIALAYLVRGLQWWKAARAPRTVPAMLGGVVAFVMGIAWFYLIGLQFARKPVQPFWIAIIAGFAWAVIGYWLFLWWTSSTGWSVKHRFAAALGATLACMVAPYLSIASWPTVDIVGEVVFDVLALIGFLLLGKNIFGGTKVTKANIPLHSE